MIIAFTGAGISKASGIPTFDEMGDLREKLSREFAIKHKEEFSDIMDMLKDTCSKASPNDAHLALAEYNIPVITMNIDGLHRKALNRYNRDLKPLIEIHGNVFDDNVVLYGDKALKYPKAYRLIGKLRKKDILLIIGTSYYTYISSYIKNLAEISGANIVEINNDAEHKVREFIESHKEQIEDYDSFIRREKLY